MAFSAETGYVDLGKHATGGGNTVRERRSFINHDTDLVTANIVHYFR